jgi:hypothetical protein
MTNVDAIAELEHLRLVTADLLEELTLLRSGRPFHTHEDPLKGTKQRCSSPYCVDLTMQGVRDHA